MMLSKLMIDLQIKILNFRAIHTGNRQTVVVVTGGFSNKRIIYAVVVNFLSQVIFIFPLFLGMVIYANEFRERKNKNISSPLP